MGSGPRAVVVGSANVDLVVRCSRLPRPGETVLGGDVARRAGGKGANQAAAAARLGARTTLVASFGEDEAGDWLAGQVVQRGVDLAHVARSKRPTGTAFITVDDDGENQIVVAAGANLDLDASDVDLEGFDVVLAQLEVPDAVVADVAARTERLVLNVAPSRALDADLLARCAVVIANEGEAASLDLAALAHCVVTLGARGAVHYRFGVEVARAAAPVVRAVDAVGAGDVFCAAYAIRYALGEADDRALAYASVAGALATLAPGAQGALPTDEEVRSWLEPDS